MSLHQASGELALDERAIHELTLKDQEQLCEICDLLNLDKAFFSDDYKFPTTEANILGSWHRHFCWYFWQIKRNTACLLCRFLHKILLSNPEIDVDNLNIVAISRKPFYSREKDQSLPGFHVLSLSGMPNGLIRIPSDYGIWIAPLGIREISMRNTREACLAHFYPYLAPGMMPMFTTDEQAVMFDEWRDKTGKQYTVSVRQTETSELNVDIITSWIEKCETEHTEWCSAKPLPKTGPGNFRVIDIVTSNIIIAPSNCRYIALSYVWGVNDDRLLLLQSNHLEMETEGSLLQRMDSVPTTIQDAIRLCGKLNERYLWVDSLCIIQDSATEQKEQMSKMDLIYRRAVLTIIAAAGEDAYAGLPGLSIPRVKLASEKIQSIDLVVIPEDGEAEINSSKWNTRAWTFQEKLLSTRLLRFTKNFVTFECLEACWREDMDLQGEEANKVRLVEQERRDQEIRGNFHQIISDETIHFEKMVPQEKWTPVFDTLFGGSYSPLVKDYTKRQLSKPTDILNAFGGIQSALSQSIGRFHWGLPLHTLARSLCWMASFVEDDLSEKMESRPGFPSYSWAGWVFGKDSSANYGLSIEGPWPGFSTYSDEGGQTYWGSHCLKNRYIGIRPELDAMLFPTTDEKAKEMDEILIRTLDDLWEKRDEIQLSNLILFWTATVEIKPGIKDEDGKTIWDRLDRVTSRSRRGALEVGGWLEWEEVQCLLASPLSSCIDLAYMGSDSSSSWCFACILIRWTDGVARRILPQIVFTIDPEKWENEQPQQKLVVLA